MFGCYRRGDANDPDTYVTAITATLTSFGEAVVIYVTDPRTGLPATCQFLPTVHEVRAACVARAEYLRADAEAERWRNRRVLPALPLPVREPGTDFYSMCAKHGRPLGRFEAGTKWEDLVGRPCIENGDAKPIAEAWKPPTNDDLRRIYPKFDPAAADVEAFE